jgi:hypothetical protein
LTSVKCDDLFLRTSHVTSHVIFWEIFAKLLQLMGQWAHTVINDI